MDKAFGRPITPKVAGITWRVLHTIEGVTDRTEFGEDSTAAEEFFNVCRLRLRNINDRVVLHRINRKSYGYEVPDEERTWMTYQDPYKFAIMSPHGVIFRYAPYSPRTWEDAERIIKKLREQRRR